jgi:hypothetical protein
MSKVSRVEVISTGARRRWTLEAKRRIVSESYGGRREVSAAARRHSCRAVSCLPGVAAARVVQTFRCPLVINQSLSFCVPRQSAKVGLATTSNSRPLLPFTSGIPILCNIEASSSLSEELLKSGDVPKSPASFNQQPWCHRQAQFQSKD